MTAYEKLTKLGTIFGAITVLTAAADARAATPILTKAELKDAQLTASLVAQVNGTNYRDELKAQKIVAIQTRAETAASVKRAQAALDRAVDKFTADPIAELAAGRPAAKSVDPVGDLIEGTQISVPARPAKQKIAVATVLRGGPAQP